MTIKELYFATMQERMFAKRNKDERTAYQAEALIAYIDELLDRKYCTMEDDARKISELNAKLERNPEANARTNEALAYRIQVNRETKFKRG